MARLTGSLQVDGNISADSFTGSVQGTATSASYISIDNIDGDIQATNADLADTASYVSGSDVDGEVYQAERARRIEVGSYGSYSNLTDIPFVTGDYGSNIKRISADGILQWHAGTNHLTVPGVNATTLTGSLDWDQLENIPDGIMSSSDGIVPDGTVSSSAQIVIGDTTGNISGSRVIGDIAASSVDYDNVNNKPTLLSSSAQINFDTDPINIAIGGTSLGSSYRLSRGNVAVGAKAYECITNVCDLEQNVAVGLCAGRSIDSNSLNSIFIGHTAGGDTSACQNSNIGIGSGAHSCGGGTGNVSIGSVAGQDTTGDYNIAIGFTAARDNVGGDGNIVLGGNAGRCLTGNGSYHVLLGYNAGSTTFFNGNQFSIDESGSVFAVNAGTNNEPLIHSRYGAWGGVKDYFQINAPTSASSFEAASLTGSLNWSDLEDIPDGIMSSSDGIVPDGTISSSAQVDYEEIQNAPFSSSNPVSPILHPTIGSTDRGHVAIGEGVLEAGVSASNISYGIVAIGQNAAGGLNAGILGSDNVVIGRKAAWNKGNLIEGCTNLSVVVGAYSNSNSSGVENVTIGAQSFTSASGHNNTTIGTWAGNGYGLTGDKNTMIGYQAGGSDAAGVGMNGGSCRNTLLGAETSLRNGCCNVLIGYGAGSYTDFNNKLYIENGGSSPLIEGDFSTNYVKINDVLELNQSNPLPSGGVGQLAVSASNLYFHNGSSWSQIN